MTKHHEPPTSHTKKFSIVKSLFTFLLLIVSCALFAQASDSFLYTGVIKDNGWGSHSGLAGQMTTLAGSLKYPGVDSLGNKTQIVAGNTEDINLPSAAPLIGVAYYSALINLPNVTGQAANTTTGNYFLMLGTLSATTPPTLTVFSGRLYIRAGAAANTFNLGVLNGSGGTAAPTFSATDYSINTTYMVVVKFDLITNTVSLFVNPTLGTTEGTPTVTNVTGTTAAPAQIDAFIIREAGTATAGTGNVLIDQVKLGGTWASVTKNASTAPTVTTQAVTSIAQTTATGNGNITALGSVNPAAYGVCWNTTGTPTTADSKVDKGAASATGAFTANMTGLIANTKYYVRAFATNSASTSYGSEVTFTTLPVVVQSFTTEAVTNITSTSATLNATANIEASYRGISLNEEGLPSYVALDQALPGGLFSKGSYSGTVVNLKPATKYFIRAFGTAGDYTNPSNYEYGNEVTFTTLAVVETVPAKPNTPTFTAIKTTGFTVNWDAVPTAISYSLFVYNLTYDLIFGPINNITETSYAVSGLTAASGYNVKVQASNLIGNSVFSNFAQVNTLAESNIAPTVTTQAVTAITQTTATGNGNITDFGSPNPTAYGVCWNTTGSPTTADNKVEHGTNTPKGAFSSDMTSLTANTKYYVRAYAINSAGTSYGEEVTFTTLAAAVVAPSGLSYSPNPVVAIVNSTNVSSSPTVTGSVDRYTVKPALPDGVTLNTSTGKISGIPTVISPLTEYTLTAINDGGTANATFTLTVNNVPAGTTNIIKFSEIDGLQWFTDNKQIRYLYFNIPSCSNYDLSELGVNVDATSSSGSLKMGIYNATTKALIYQTTELPVTGGVNEYVSVPVPSGSLLLPTGFYAVAVIANPSSGNINISSAATFVNTGVATGVSTASYAKYSGIVYPNFPDPLVYDGASYRAISVVVKGIDKSPTSATVSTTAVTAVTKNSATSGGNVSADGSAAVTARGVCWNTTGSPTVSGTTKTNDGSGVGEFSSSLTNLSPNTKYYVRAYATNCTGTSYGDELSFTTLAPVAAPSALSYSPNPVVVTVNVDNVSSNPTVTGSVDSYSISPALPTGVTLNATTGVISGIPTVLSALKDYTVTASNGSGITTAKFTLTVKDVPPTPITLSQSSVETVVNSTNIYLKPSVTGVGITFSISPALPAGVTLDPTTGIISGTPSALMAKTTFTLTASNTGGSVSTNFTIEVAPVAPTTSATQAFCSSATVSELVATAPAGCTVRWYTAATSGTLLTSSTALATATTYYAESWSGAVASITRTVVVVTINTPPAKPIIAGQSTANSKVKLCPNDYIVCTNYDSNLSYQWRKEGVDIVNEKAGKYSVPASGAGNYSLYVKNLTTGCENVSDPVAVTLYSVTIPVIYEKKKSDNISILIVDNTLNLYASYVWTYANGSALPSSIVNNRQFLVLPPSDMNASYMVNITDNNACTASSISKAVVLKSIEAKVYPTLITDNFNVKLDGEKQEGALTVKIFNQNGNQLRAYSFEHVQSEVAYQINSSGLVSGLYTVEVSLGSYKQTQKVIIK